MASRPSPTWAIALVVIRDLDRFVLVHELRGRGWYLPAGRVDHGEALIDGARREAREESGLEIEIDGIIRIEHTPAHGRLDARLRIVFLAHAIGGAIKTEPDEHSLGAKWVRLADLVHLPLRASEVAWHLAHVAGGGFVAPLELLTAEGAPYSNTPCRS